MRNISENNTALSSSHYAFHGYQTLSAGFISGGAAFVIKWVPDTFTTRARLYKHPIMVSAGLNASTTNYLNAVSPGRKYRGLWPLTQSLFNIGFCWGFCYKVAEGCVTLPMQKFFAHQLTVNYFHDHDVAHHPSAIIHALAGWLASMVEILLLHPLDSMKIKAQKNPDIFQHHSWRYFLTHQPELRRGMGVAALRNTISNPSAWAIKACVDMRLKKTTLNQSTQSAISATLFTFIRIVSAYPVDTIKVWAQDSKMPTTIPSTFFNKTKHTLQITQRTVKKNGFRALYRGFFAKGGSSFLGGSVQMWVFDYLTKGSCDTNHH